MKLTGKHRLPFKCSYCDREKENEIHLYIECDITDHFIGEAQNWFRQTFGATPSLMLNGPRLFGLENEPTNLKMGWTLPAMNGNTLINLNPWRNKTT